ncbi:MAG: DNA polymerase III subunit alpha, partial [Chloroflexota bacterium]
MILLRTQSRFSFHRATASIKELVNAAAEAGMSHLALTDYYGLFGAVRFVERCKKNGVQPIIGMMAQVQLPYSGRPDHLTLLAKNSQGYQSLCELSTIHQTTKETQQGGISWERFIQSAAGLICIVGGHAQEELRPFSQLFGDDGYFALNQQSSEEWIAVGEASGLAPVWCQPVYHVNPADVDMFRVLQAIDQNIRLEEVDPTTLPKNVGWPSGKFEVTSDQSSVVWSMATDNTYAIAAKCVDCLPDGRPLWPVLKLPDGKSAAQLLEEKCQTKLKTLYEDVAPKIEERLAAELKLITQHNFEPLFLILAEVIEFVRENRILMGSRGSVANSLVAYCLGISLVDPIKYDLLFERFLNPERKSLPDIDLDFESRNGRDAVLGFIRERYGEHRVALVSTINTYRKRSAVRETAKAYGMSSAEISRMSKQLPSSWRHPDPERRSKSPVEAIIEIATNDREKEILEMAVRIMNFPSHMGLHPGGIVVSPPEKMTDHCPLFLSPKGFLATQFDYRDVETLGLIKMDVLGIRALTVIEIAIEEINRQDAGSKLQVEDIPFDDKATGDLIEKGATLGVFQYESTGSQRTLRQLKARDLWGLALANAFFKPGPATGGQAKNFIRRIRGEEEVSYMHPALESILSKTAGVLVFQEDVLRICTEIGKLNWTEANSIRKGMSKFEGSR